MEIVLIVAIIVAAGWFSRRRSQPSASTTPRAQQVQQLEAPRGDYGPLVRLAGCDRVGVVGESHYQPALKAAAGGSSSRGYEDALRVQAMVVPEPSNPYDRKAVRVDVGGRTVGYLSSDRAEGYQAVLLKELRGQTGWCVGRITGGGGDRSYGIYLHLSAPDSLVPVNEANGLELLEGDRSVTVTQQDKHQDVIAPLTQGVLLPAAVFASLVRVPIQRGKYAGEETLEVRIGGQRVGELTKRMADRYRPMVAAAATSDKVSGCEAVISSTDRGYRVSLAMPRVDD